MAEFLKDGKSLGDRFFRRFSMREKTNGIPLVKKSSKPLTEKRRRDRINKCLVQLKNIIFRARGKEDKKFARLEKADILEMTIGHLMEIHGQETGPNSAGTNLMMKYSPENIPSMHGCMRRVEAMRDLNPPQEVSNEEEPSIYLAPGDLLATPRYYCGNSQNQTIKGVNFGRDDVIVEDDIMCGSASRVFMLGDDYSGATSMEGNDGDDLLIQRKQDKVSPITNFQNYNLSNGFHDNKYYGNHAVDIRSTKGPKTTSTPVSRPIRSSTPIMGVSAYCMKITPPDSDYFYRGQGQPKTSTPLRSGDLLMQHERMMDQRYKDNGQYGRSFTSPEDFLSFKGQGHQEHSSAEMKFDISPDLRTRLFYNSSASSEDSHSASNKGSDEESGSRLADTTDYLWQPWK